MVAYNEPLVCQLGSMPFTYSGLSFGTNKPSVEHLMLFFGRIKKRLLGCAQLLTSVGKLKMVNSIVFSSPTFYLSSMLIYRSVTELLDKYIRHCNNKGSDLPKNYPSISSLTTSE